MDVARAGCHEDTGAKVTGENARRSKTDRLVRINPRPELRKISDGAISLISEGFDDVVNWGLRRAMEGLPLDVPPESLVEFHTQYTQDTKISQ